MRGECNLKLFDPLVDETKMHPNLRSILSTGNGYNMDVLFGGIPLQEIGTLGRVRAQPFVDLGLGQDHHHTITAVCIML
jgi:hypothetical protein